METLLLDNLTIRYLVTGLVFFFVFALISAIWRAILRAMYRKGKIAETNFWKTVAFPGYFFAFALTFYVCGQYLNLATINPQIFTLARILFNASLLLIVGEILFFAGMRYYAGSRPGEEFPSIFRQLLKGLVYLILFLSFLSNSYNVDITPLLTTSAVFTMVLGLALQDVLGNLFSGLSVHISPPFKIGDWIQINNFMGKVVESNWRATTLRLSTGAMVILPNNHIARNEITNFSDSAGSMFQEFTVGLPYTVSPERIRRILTGACRQVDEIYTRPSPLIILDKFDEYSINYKIRFWIANEDNPDRVTNQLASRIWYRLKREDISIPFPIQDLYLHQEKDNRHKIIEHRLGLIAGIDFLAGLELEQKQFIAERLEECWYETGEEIVVEGAYDSDFYVIDRGRVSVIIARAGSRPVAELQEGDFFGEMSLLTGEKRSATVCAKTETRLLKLSRDSMGRLLSENEKIAEALSASLAQRQSKNAELLETHRVSQSGKKGSGREFDGGASKAAILQRIRSFFKLA
jgi:small-conductance mechanosensitive channel/CRP-like cAMP-binding protein